MKKRFMTLGMLLMTLSLSACKQEDNTNIYEQPETYEEETATHEIAVETEETETEPEEENFKPYGVMEFTGLFNALLYESMTELYAFDWFIVEDYTDYLSQFDIAINGVTLPDKALFGNIENLTLTQFMNQLDAQYNGNIPHYMWQDGILKSVDIKGSDDKLMIVEANREKNERSVESWLTQLSNILEDGKSTGTIGFGNYVNQTIEIGLQLADRTVVDVLNFTEPENFLETRISCIRTNGPVNSLAPLANLSVNGITYGATPDMAKAALGEPYIELDFETSKTFIYKEENMLGNAMVLEFSNNYLESFNIKWFNIPQLDNYTTYDILKYDNETSNKLERVVYVEERKSSNIRGQSEADKSENKDTHKTLGSTADTEKPETRSQSVESQESLSLDSLAPVPDITTGTEQTGTEQVGDGQVGVGQTPQTPQLPDATTGQAVLPETTVPVTPQTPDTSGTAVSETPVALP